MTITLIRQRMQAEIKELVKPIEKFGYFKVPEFNSSYDNYIESSMAGFASHSSRYDVGVIFDKELGMFIVPFTEHSATFLKQKIIKKYRAGMNA